MEAIACCRPLGSLTWRECRQPGHPGSHTHRERLDAALLCQSQKLGPVSSSAIDHVGKAGRRSAEVAGTSARHAISHRVHAVSGGVHGFGGSSLLGERGSGTQRLSYASLLGNGRRPCRGQIVCGLFGLGVPEIAVIAGVALVLFGPKKLPEVGKSLGKTVKSFQEAAKEFESELKSASSESTESTDSSNGDQTSAGTKTEAAEKM